MRNLSRTERIMNHIEANINLYYSSLIEINNSRDGEVLISSAILGSRNGRRFPLRYTFRDEDQRLEFINRFQESYPDVPIIEIE